MTTKAILGWLIVWGAGASVLARLIGRAIHLADRVEERRRQGVSTAPRAWETEVLLGVVMPTRDQWARDQGGWARQ